MSFKPRHSVPSSTFVRDVLILRSRLSAAEPVAIAFVSPSVTPYVGRNPSFRVFDYRRPANGSAREPLLLDYKQYM